MAGREKRIGLALGGGGARGLAHVGVLRVLEQIRFPFEIVVGTSMGSIVGAMYLQLGSANRVHQRLRDFLDSPAYREAKLDRLVRRKNEHDFFGHVASAVRERLVINLALSRRSLFDGQKLTEALSYLLEPGRIEDYDGKFAAVAVDLLSGQEAVIARGDIIKGVQASCTLPGFLPPCEYEGRLLVDGALRASLPVRAARGLGADWVVAVDVGHELEPQPELENILDIMTRCQAVLSKTLREFLGKEADVLIRPEVGTVHWSRFDLLEELVEKGEQAARQALPALQELVSRRWPAWKRWLGKLR